MNYEFSKEDNFVLTNKGLIKADLSKMANSIKIKEKIKDRNYDYKNIKDRKKTKMIEAIDRAFDDLDL